MYTRGSVPRVRPSIKAHDIVRVEVRHCGRIVTILNPRRRMRSIGALPFPGLRGWSHHAGIREWIALFVRRGSRRAGHRIGQYSGWRIQIQRVPRTMLRNGRLSKALTAVADQCRASQVGRAFSSQVPCPDEREEVATVVVSVRLSGVDLGQTLECGLESGSHHGIYR